LQGIGDPAGWQAANVLDGDTGAWGERKAGPAETAMSLIYIFLGLFIC